MTEPAASSMIRALTYDGTTISLDTQRARPEPAPGEAILRPTRLGISALDRAAARGLTGFTGVLGHEFVGVVESINGNDTLGLKGRRVVGAIGSICGECDLCTAGLSSHCRQRTLLGLHNRDGCFAEAFTMPIANLVPVPDSVDDDHAVFAQPLAAALQAARQLTIEGKPYITVLGDGPLGLLTVQLMAKLNASVRLIGRHTEKFGLCEKWGIKHRHVDDIGRRADQDIVVDCTGSPHGLVLASQLARPRGKIVLKTLVSPMDAKPLDLSPIVLHEQELIGSHCGSISDAVALLARGEVDVISLISKRSSLAQAQNAWRLAEHSSVVKLLMEV